MDLSNLLAPWFALAAVLLPLAYAERWIHSHLYGVGWLLTNEPRSATVLYYLILSPGVFVHEFVQWLAAGALNVETDRLMAWPEAQEDGTLRLDFVSPKNAGRMKTAIIGAIPLIVGLALIGYISTSILDLDTFLSAILTGDITVIGPAARQLASTADFYLWLYLMFALTNAMMPTPEERSGWLIFAALFAGVLAFLVIIGVGDVLVETFTGPVAHGVNLLTTAFGTILVMEIGAILVIGFFEEILERITKRKFTYARQQPEEYAREPGSNLPLAPGEPFPSIYNLNLPLPDPSIRPELDARKRRAAASPAGARPVMPESRPPREPGLAPSAAQPGLPALRSAAPPSGDSLRREPVVGLRAAPSLAENRRAAGAAEQPEHKDEPLKRAEHPGATPGVSPRRESSPLPARTLPGERPLAERPARPAVNLPVPPAERSGSAPFASRSLPGAPASPDRARPAAPGPASGKLPSGTPARPSALAGLRPEAKGPGAQPRRSEEENEAEEPDAAQATPSDSGDDDVEYVDFDDL